MLRMESSASKAEKNRRVEEVINQVIRHQHYLKNLINNFYVEA